MTLTMHKESARKAVLQGKELGFDLLNIQVKQSQEKGVRVALGAVCRENCDIDQTVFEVTGYLDGRVASSRFQAESKEEILAQLKELSENIKQQSPSAEFVLPCQPRGKYRCDIENSVWDSFEETSSFYETLGAHLTRFRKGDARISGFLQATRDSSFLVSSEGFELETRDTSALVKFTVDNPVSKASGVGLQTLLGLNKDAVSLATASALEEAFGIFEKSKDPVAISPGDYTVVMHPAVTEQLLLYPLFYDMFDRRKIEEGRTFLSRSQKELHFPSELCLEQDLTLSSKKGAFCALPFSPEGRIVKPARFISEGRIHELVTSPWWSTKTGIPTTFSSAGAPVTRLSVKEGSSLEQGCDTLQDLIARTERGIYMHSVWYIRMVSEMEGILTGMTRDGLFEIRDGKITRPVINMRWHENLIGMLTRVSGASSSLSVSGKSPYAIGVPGWGPGYRETPALRVENFHFSSSTLF